MKQLLLIFLALIFSSVYGQNKTTIHQSNIFEDGHGESYIVYAKKDSIGGIYIVRKITSKTFEAGGYYIEYYDKSLNMAKDFEFFPEYYTYEKNKILLGVISDNEDIHIIDFHYNVK